MTITAQYLEATRKVQDNWFAAFDAMTTQYVRQLERPVATVFPTVDARKAVDEVFDFAAKALTVQRETAHKVLSANYEIAQQWRTQSTELQGAWREQAKVVTDITRDQLEAFTNSAREQALSVGETVEKQAATVRSAADEAARTVKTATEKQVGIATEAAAEQTKRNYNLMNSAQLKGELAARKLAATGSLDEMRARLKDADAKA